MSSQSAAAGATGTRKTQHATRRLKSSQPMVKTILPMKMTVNMAMGLLNLKFSCSPSMMRLKNGEIPVAIAARTGRSRDPRVM